MDKSFTQDILTEKISRHIVESVVGLAGKLDINTVADGVETQANCLCSLGGGSSAGGYFGRPEKVTTFCCKYNQRQWCNQCLLKNKIKDI